MVHFEKVGGDEDFHFNNKSLLGDTDMNAIESLLTENLNGADTTANRTVKTLGTIFFPVTPDKASKISDQNLFKNRQPLNICVYSAGACWHRSHKGDTTRYFCQMSFGVVSTM